MIPKNHMDVIIPCKDRVTNLEYCLASINAGEYTPNTILVDFGSAAPLATYGDMYPWLTVVRAGDSSDLFHKSRAMNVGIKRSKAKFICATDSDQIFGPKFFKFFVLATRKPRRLVLCKTYFLPSSPECKPAEIQNHFDEYLEIAKDNKPLRGEGCCIGLPRDWLLRVNGWDEEYKGYGAEDSDVIFRARCAGFTPEYLNGRTSMVHLPHERYATYHSMEILQKNKARYHKMKRKYCASSDQVANKGKVWGAV